MTDSNATQNYIAKAIDAHQIYVDLMVDYINWLECGDFESNALKVVLWQLINTTIKKRYYGEFKDLSEDIMPPAYALNNMLDQERINQFEFELREKRDQIEGAALNLIEIVDSTEFLMELDALPLAEKYTYAAQLGEHLSSCNVGLLFLRKSINAPPETPLKLFHPERIFQVEGNFFSDTFPIVRRAGKVFANYFLNLVPALTAEFNISRFTALTVNLIFKYFPEEVVGDVDQVFNDVLEFELLLKRLRDFHEHNSMHLTRIGGTAVGSVLLIIELGNVYISVSRMLDNPNSKNTFQLLSSVATLRLALNSAQSVLKNRIPSALAPKTVLALTIVTAVHDIATHMIDLHEAYEESDLSVAAGHGLVAVGLAGAASIAAWNAATTAGMLAPSMEINPLAGALLSLSALLVTFTGTMLVSLTADSPIETWFLNNYFGRDGLSVKADRPPESILFEWHREDGKFNIARQISEYLSMFYPIGLEINAELDNPNLILVKLNKPTFAYHESVIVVERIYDRGIISDSPRFDFIPIYAKSLAAQDDLFPGENTRRNQYSPLNPQPGDRLDEWFRIFSPIELTQGMDPYFDPSGHFLEITLSIPDQFQQSLSALIQLEGIVLERFPMILRSRKIMP